MEVDIKRKGVLTKERVTIVDTGIKFNTCRIFLMIPELLKGVPPQKIVKDFAHEMNTLVRGSSIIVPDASVSKAIKELEN